MLGLGAFALFAGFGAIVLATDKPVRWLGGVVQSVRNRFKRKATPIEGLPDRMVYERNRIRDVLGRRWKAATLLTQRSPVLRLRHPAGLHPGHRGQAQPLTGAAGLRRGRLAGPHPHHAGRPGDRRGRALGPARLGQRPGHRRRGGHAGLSHHLVLAAHLRRADRLRHVPHALRAARTRRGPRAASHRADRVARPWRPGSSGRVGGARHPRGGRDRRPRRIVGPRAAGVARRPRRGSHRHPGRPGRGHARALRGGGGSVANAGDRPLPLRSVAVVVVLVAPSNRCACSATGTSRGRPRRGHPRCARRPLVRGRLPVRPGRLPRGRPAVCRRRDPLGVVHGGGRRGGHAAVVLGFEGGERHDGTFRLRRRPDGGVELAIEAFLGGAVLGPGEARPLHAVRWARAKEGGPGVPELLAGWARRVGRAGGARVDAPFGVGWCSWYHYFEAVTEDDIVANLRRAADWRFDVFQVDDGYQAAIGDSPRDERHVPLGTGRTGSPHPRRGP